MGRCLAFCLVVLGACSAQLHLGDPGGPDAAAPDGSRGIDGSINNGPDAGEAVPHLHLHLLAGRPLDWPPG